MAKLIVSDVDVKDRRFWFALTSTCQWDGVIGDDNRIVPCQLSSTSSKTAARNMLSHLGRVKAMKTRRA